jgi:hypothetical protein
VIVQPELGHEGDELLVAVHREQGLGAAPAGDRLEGVEGVVGQASPLERCGVAGVVDVVEVLPLGVVDGTLEQRS